VIPRRLALHLPPAGRNRVNRRSAASVRTEAGTSAIVTPRTELGSAMRDAAPDLLELLTGFAMGDLDQVQTQVGPFLQEFAQVGL
jgi:hypothetical protein